MLVSFTASIDLAGRGKRLGSWHLYSTDVAGATVQFRDSATNELQWTVFIPQNTSASQAYPSLPYFEGGLDINVSAGVLTSGCVDIL